MKTSLSKLKIEIFKTELRIVKQEAWFSRSRTMTTFHYLRTYSERREYQGSMTFPLLSCLVPWSCAIYVEYRLPRVSK